MRMQIYNYICDRCGAKWQDGGDNRGELYFMDAGGGILAGWKDLCAKCVTELRELLQEQPDEIEVGLTEKGKEAAQQRKTDAELYAEPKVRLTKKGKQLAQARQEGTPKETE